MVEAEKREYPRIGEKSGAPVRHPWTNVDTRTPDALWYSDELWRARCELAAAYQLCDKLGFNEGVCNHLTCVAPGREDAFLCAPYGWRGAR